METSRFRLLRKGDYIHGSFLKPETVDGFINGVNPGDRADVLGRFPFSEASVDEAIGYATIGARTWRRIALNDRANAVRRFRDHLARFQERLASLITRETGKPVWEARHEVIGAVRMIDVYLDDGISALAPKVIDDIGARGELVPRGVAALIGPYNFPLGIAATNAAAAILAGNAVVFKPSKFAPGVGQSIAELWDRSALPRGVFNMVHGSGSVIGRKLATHPGIDLLLFTGSYATATTLRRALFERPDLAVSLQSGGKGIALVMEDADIHLSVYEIMVGAFLTAGQRHNSTGRVIVTEPVYEAFVAELLRRTKMLTVGYGFEPDVFMGPLISENHRGRYMRYGKALEARGHEAVLAPAHDKPGRRGFYVRPSIYKVHWENGHPFLNDEPSGPTLLVYRVQNWEEAVALHNQAVFRHTASVFTEPHNPALDEIRQRVRTGSFNLNRGTISASIRLSSEPLGRSSNATPTGIDLLRMATAPRAFLLEGRPFDPSAVLPGTHWNEATMEEDESDELSTTTLEVAVDS